jgi:hypothetical protein
MPSSTIRATPINPSLALQYEFESHGTEGSWTSSLDDSALAIVPQWHPKMTISRLFIISSTLALGTAKAACAYRDTDSVFVPVTLEWVTSTVVFIM